MTDAPLDAAVCAADSPAGPPPRMTISQALLVMGCFHLHAWAYKSLAGLTIREIIDGYQTLLTGSHSAEQTAWRMWVSMKFKGAYSSGH